MNDVEAKILEMWNNGASTRQIGIEIGKTKGSICGLLWRMRRRGLVIPTRQQVAVSEKYQQEREKSREKKIALKPKDRPDLLKKFAKPIPPNSLNIGFWNLQSNSCRYVVNDGRPEQFIFCGAPKERGAYCEAHAKICFIEKITVKKTPHNPNGQSRNYR